MYVFYLFFFFKQKTAYEMRISDWSSDVCSSDLPIALIERATRRRPRGYGRGRSAPRPKRGTPPRRRDRTPRPNGRRGCVRRSDGCAAWPERNHESNGLVRIVCCLGWSAQGHAERADNPGRSEEHTSELQSLMRNSYASACLKKHKHTIKRIYH